MKTVKTRGSEYSSDANITVTNNAEFFIFRSFKLLSFSSFPLVFFFRHSHDLFKVMFLSLMQIEAIAEESSPLVEIGLRQDRFQL